jgi:hypothetical protein
MHNNPPLVLEETWAEALLQATRFLTPLLSVKKAIAPANHSSQASLERGRRAMWLQAAISWAKLENTVFSEEGSKIRKLLAIVCNQDAYISLLRIARCMP